MTDTTPLWIKRLLGVSTYYYPRWLWHNNRAKVCVGLAGEAAEQQWNYVKRLRYLDTIYVQGPPTRSNLERLTELSCLGRLKTVSIQFRDYYFRYDRTDKNWWGTGTEVYVGPEITEPIDLRPLLALSDVETICLKCRSISIENIKQLLSSPMLADSSVRKISCNNVKISDAEFASLAELAGDRVVLQSGKRSSRDTSSE